MRRIVIAAIVALWGMPPHASTAEAAFDMQGADLLEWCAAYADEGGGDGVSAALCSGFIMGTAATLATLSADGRIPPIACPPAEASLKDFIRAVVRWLRDNPDSHDWRAEVAVAAALSDAFPCSNRGASLLPTRQPLGGRNPGHARETACLGNNFIKNYSPARHAARCHQTSIVSASRSPSVFLRVR